MSGLPNLARLIEQELPEITQTMRDGTEIVWCGTVGDTYVGWTPRGDAEANGHPVKRLDQHPALIAAAPEMAALLIECAEALTDIANPDARKAREGQPHASSLARATLARLADFDGQLQANSKPTQNLEQA